MKLRAHSDRCEGLPEGLPDDMDLMIEAKDKEQAVLHLYEMYDLHPVIHASLRPPLTQKIDKTKGRKSARKTRFKIKRPMTLKLLRGESALKVTRSMKGTLADASQPSFNADTTFIQDTMSPGRSQSDSGEIHTSSMLSRRKDGGGKKGKKVQK